MKKTVILLFMSLFVFLVGCSQTTTLQDADIVMNARETSMFQEMLNDDPDGFLDSFEDKIIRITGGVQSVSGEELLYFAGGIISGHFIDMYPSIRFVFAGDYPSELDDLEPYHMITVQGALYFVDYFSLTAVLWNAEIVDLNPPMEADYEMTCSDLIMEFNDDYESADLTYDFSIIQVEGIISEFLVDGIIFEEEDSNLAIYAYCLNATDYSSYEVGDTITIKGIYHTDIGAPFIDLHGCVILD